MDNCCNDLGPDSKKQPFMLGNNPYDKNIAIIVDNSKSGVPSFPASGSIKDIDVVISDCNISEEVIEKLNEQ